MLLNSDVSAAAILRCVLTPAACSFSMLEFSVPVIEWQGDAYVVSQLSQARPGHWFFFLELLFSSRCGYWRLVIVIPEAAKACDLCTKAGLGLCGFQVNTYLSKHF